MGAMVGFKGMVGSFKKPFGLFSPSRSCGSAVMSGERSQMLGPLDWGLRTESQPSLIWEVGPTRG